jgi:hypothetical protein
MITMHAYVKDVMTTGVIAARPGASYPDLAAVLHEHRISGFPVVDGEGVVVGVVSESDLLARQAAPRPHRKHADPARLTAADLMSWPPVTSPTRYGTWRAWSSSGTALPTRLLRHIQLLQPLRTRDFSPGP